MGRYKSSGGRGVLLAVGVFEAVGVIDGVGVMDGVTGRLGVGVGSAVAGASVGVGTPGRSGL